MPCSFGLLPHPRSTACSQHHGPLEVTVTVRYVPLLTAAYGTRVTRPARTTWLGLAATAPDGRRVRPVLGDHRLVGKSPKGSRQPGGDLNPASPSRRVQVYAGVCLTCMFTTDVCYDIRLYAHRM
jgi:hypothetical protein